MGLGFILCLTFHLRPYFECVCNEISCETICVIAQARLKLYSSKNDNISPVGSNTAKKHATCAYSSLRNVYSDFPASGPVHAIYAFSKKTLNKLQNAMSNTARIILTIIVYSEIMIPRFRQLVWCLSYMYKVLKWHKNSTHSYFKAFLLTLSINNARKLTCFNLQHFVRNMHMNVWKSL